MRPALFGGSPEWTAGVRRHPTAVVAAAVVLLVCACIPYAGFPALYLAAAACGAFYAANEPLQLLLLPGKGAARLLARKIFTAWRNYFLMTAPFAVLALLAQPRSAWMAAAWAPLAALGPLINACRVLPNNHRHYHGDVIGFPQYQRDNYFLLAYRILLLNDIVQPKYDNSVSCFILAYRVF